MSLLLASGITPPPSQSQPWAIFRAAAVATVVFAAFTANLPADIYPSAKHNLVARTVVASVVPQPWVSYTRPSLPRLDAEDFRPYRAYPYPFGSVATAPSKPQPWWLWRQQARWDFDQSWLITPSSSLFAFYRQAISQRTTFNRGPTAYVLHESNSGFPRQPDRSWPSFLLTRVAPTGPSITVYARHGISPQLMPKWDDESSIHSWQAYHDIRHRTLRKSASLAGVTITQTGFGGTLDTAWFRRHLMAHIALDHIQPVGGAMSANSLGIRGWENEEDFYHWHLVHALIHVRLDQLYGTVV